MKKRTILGTIVGVALLTAAPFSLQWSQKTVTLSLDSADARIGHPLTPFKRCRRPPKSISPRSLRNSCCLRRRVVLRGLRLSRLQLRLSGFWLWVLRLRLSRLWLSIVIRHRLSRLWLWRLLPAGLSGRPPGGDPSRPLALRRQPPSKKTIRYAGSIFI